MIYLATDHRGFELKEKIKTWLSEWGYQYEDMGAFEYEKDDDYPDFVHKAAKKVSEDPENSKAIILGGSGQGEAMVANRYKGVRAVVYYGGSAEWVIKTTREHNNANVLSLGTSFLTDDETQKSIKLWLDTPFSGDERHKRRLAKF
ncbi:MAG: ribose 5-phosphate isomerase B [Parcubacteria group bacterium Gr01-1014_2]|nr:MAG: ribose 5-phosphate isomerase B [Parcubacteria group bacterium Gr01-1014_2]